VSKIFDEGFEMSSHEVTLSAYKLFKRSNIFYSMC
jgi:hypothetical protein